jgi:hypothetical protein
MLRSRIAIALCCLSICGCGKPAAQTPATDTMVKASGIPSAADVAAAQKAGNHDTGGQLTGEITGGKSAHIDIHDIGYCVSKGPAGSSIEVFALAGNDPKWSVSISSLKGMPALGTHEVAEGSMSAFTVHVVDKSTGTEPSAWQRYHASSGSVTISKTAEARVEGTLTVQAAPQSPQTGGPTIDVTANFAAPQAPNCM